MLLENKNAIVYGAGAIGRAVAIGFARVGANVLRSTGGSVETAQLDALDEMAVDAHADAVAAQSGSIDVSFDLISVGDIQGTPLAEMSLRDFEQPIHNAVRTTFLTSKAAARHMIRQRSGVILTFGGVGDPMRVDHWFGDQPQRRRDRGLKRTRRKFQAESGGRAVPPDWL